MGKWRYKILRTRETPTGKKSPHVMSFETRDSAENHIARANPAPADQWRVNTYILGRIVRVWDSHRTRCAAGRHADTPPDQWVVETQWERYLGGEDWWAEQSWAIVDSLEDADAKFDAELASQHGFKRNILHVCVLEVVDSGP